SSRLTRGPLISSCSRLFFSVTWMSRNSLSYNASSAAARLSAFWTPLDRPPSRVVAAYANLGMSDLHYVDRAHDLGRRGDPGGDQGDRLLLQGAHALGAAQLAQFVVRTLVEDQLADRVGDRHQLVHPDPLEVAGVCA